MKTSSLPSPLKGLHSLWTSLGKSVEVARQHQDLFTLCLVYGITRLFAALFTQQTFTPYGPAISAFVEQGQFSIGGAYPFINYWVEYPPLFPWLNVAAYRLSLFFPSWGDSTMWVAALMRWTIVPFEVGILALVYALSARVNPSGNRMRSVFMYGAAFVTLYVPLGWFDALPLFWVLLALYFVVRDQAALTGLSVGLGMLAKPLSPLVLPAAWQRLTGVKAKIRLGVASLVAFALPLVPFVILNPALMLAHWRNLLSRPSWETVWAFLDGYYGFGVVPPLDQRFDPGTAIWQNHPGGSYTLWATLAFALLGLYLWTRRIDWRDARRTVAFVGLTWCLFILWSKGYSPQWAINLIPFIALLLPNIRGGVYLGLVAVALLGEWPVAFVLLSGHPGYLVAITLWRTALYILLAFEFGTLVLAGPAARYWQRAYWAALGLLIVSGGLIGRDAFAQYTQSRLAKEPLHDTIQVLRQEVGSQTGVICRDIAVCERLAPYVPGVAYFWLPAPSSWQANYLPAFAQSHAVLWMVVDTNEDSAVEKYLSERYGKESQTWAGGMRLARFIALTPSAEQPAQAAFGCCLQLKSYALHAEGRYLSLKLNWQATAPVKTSYKLFVHVYNLAGELVAQNDQYPAGEFWLTDQWVAGQTVSDWHGLIMPEPVTSGYRLSLGWYDPNSGQRLPSGGAAGDSFEIVIP
jgi:hypothetical protein